MQAADSDAMARSVAAGHRVELDDVGLFCDGTAVKMVGEETFRLARELVDEFVIVDTDAVCAAIKDVFHDTRSILEPAGALGVAGLKQYVDAHGLRGQTLVAVTSGANMNFDRLRFVAERAEEREALFAVTIPEERGSFRRFSELVGTAVGHRVQLPHLGHRRGARVRRAGHARPRATRRRIAREFVDAGFATIDLTHDELAKEHVRHMVGGRSQLGARRAALPVPVPRAPRRADAVPGQHAHRLEHQPVPLPQPGRRLRPGARRAAGAPAATTPRSPTFLETLAYPYEDETTNPVYQLFLR